MGEGKPYSTYELPFLKLLKYFLIFTGIGFLIGWTTRYTTVDYWLALWIWQTFFLTYYYITLPAIGLMCIVAYYTTRKKQPRATVQNIGQSEQA